MAGFEYFISQGGTPAVAPDTWSIPPFFWNETPIGFDPPVPLNGFTVGVRYYIISSVPDPITGVINTSRAYPAWILESQTLVTLSPHTYPPGPYTTTTGNELFTAVAGPYLGFYADAGITNGTAYSYSKVFDQTEHYYIERDFIPPQAPPAVDGSVEAVPYFPQEPYDPANNIYPTSAITRFIPDPRKSVTVNYQLTTTYKLTEEGASITDVINITQIVTQNTNDWSSLAKAEINKTAYKNGLYNTQVIPT